MRDNENYFMCVVSGALITQNTQEKSLILNAWLNYIFGIEIKEVSNMKNYLIKLEIKNAIHSNDIKKLELINSRYPVEFEKFILEIVK